MDRTEEIQDCLGALNRLRMGTYHTLDDLAGQMPSTVSRKTLITVLDHCLALKIVSRLGSHFIIRRQTSREDLLTICGELQLRPLDGPSTLPNDRLRRLEEDITDMQQQEIRPQHHWLGLNFERMPVSARNALHEMAVKTTGAGAPKLAVENQMLLISARILTHALRHLTKEVPPVLPPRPID